MHGSSRRSKLVNHPLKPASEKRLGILSGHESACGIGDFAPAFSARARLAYRIIQPQRLAQESKQVNGS
jgi:hypothetical protein